MNNTEEADKIFDQFIRDALSTETPMPISDEDLEVQFNKLKKLIEKDRSILSGRYPTK